MIIGIDASRANNSEKTGVEWYGYSLIQELKQFSIFNFQFPNGQPCRFILYTNKPLQGELANLPEGWTEKVLRWPPKRLWTQVRLSWEMLFHPPDVLFIPAHVFPVIHPKKTVMTIHDIAAAKFPQSYNWFERWYSLWSAKYAVKKLWRVIVPSEFTKQELIQTFKHLNAKTFDKIFAIPHGYDERYELKNIYLTNIIRQRRTSIWLEQILNKYYIDKPFIMTIGRLEEKKNNVRIIGAFNNLKFKIKNLKLLLVGKPGYGYEKVRKAIADSPFKQDIIQPGWVGEADLPYLMNAAEVFVFPSQYEGFGLPVLEAMACGAPVVTSHCPALKEVGGDAVLYVEPENREEIANAIIKFLENKELRREKIQKGFERAKRFSWDKCAKETLNVLLGIVI